jgi:hypothetical protein
MRHVMPYFDTFDIVEAHYCFASDYHGGQGSNLYATVCRILNPDRIGLKPTYDLSFDTLEENGKMIYNELEVLYGFPATDWCYHEWF